MSGQPGQLLLLQVQYVIQSTSTAHYCVEMQNPYFLSENRNQYRQAN